MATYRKWTITELDFIKDNHINTPDEELAVKLSKITSTNITTAMVRRQRRKLKLNKPRGRPCKIKPVTANPTESPTET